MTEQQQQLIPRRPPIDDSRDRMTPQEFVARWDVSVKRLAKICGCCQSVVEKWFMEGKPSYTEPKPYYCRLLFLQDEKWNNTIRVNKIKAENDRINGLMYKRSA